MPTLGANKSGGTDSVPVPVQSNEFSLSLEVINPEIILAKDSKTIDSEALILKVSLFTL